MTTTPALSLDTLARLDSEAGHAIAAAADLSALDDLRVAYLGKKGEVSLLMRSLGQMSGEDRQIFGPALNGLRDRLAFSVEARAADLRIAARTSRLAAEALDMTLPPLSRAAGSIHPVSQVMDELTAIFADMGFVVADGPDIEDDFHNFTALNFPVGHPAREMHDTFFLEATDGAGNPLVLRTHTSPVQIRAMLADQPPIRVIAPGRTYRCDWDATHTPMFHQIEGLVIDKATHMGHLKGCLIDFVRSFFEIDEVTTRFRPHFFPFTEPSAEMDIGYEKKDGAISIGAGGNWMEILGCGMVHPNVLRQVGYDPDIYQGFAFGTGVDRLAMLKYGMADLRPFFEPDLHWLRHYGFNPTLTPSLAQGLAV
jgi:phenylalanyl-tRNA synthetase alpha chain